MEEKEIVSPEEWEPGQYAPAPTERLNDPVFDDATKIEELESPIGSTRKLWVCWRCMRWDSPRDVEDCSCLNRTEQEIVFRSGAFFDPHVVTAVMEDLLANTSLTSEEAEALTVRILKTTYKTMRGPNPYALS